MRLTIEQLKEELKLYRKFALELADKYQKEHDCLNRQLEQVGKVDAVNYILPLLDDLEAK